MSNKFYLDDKLENEIDLNAATVAAFGGQAVAVELGGETAQWMDANEFIPAFYPTPARRNEAFERLTM